MKTFTDRWTDKRIDEDKAGFDYVVYDIKLQKTNW